MVELAARLLRSFNTSLDSVDTHAAAVLGPFDEHVDHGKAFAHQAFYGCQRMRRVLEVVLNALYAAKGAELPRGDYYRLMVLAYVALFRVGDAPGMMSWAQFRALADSQAASRVHILLSFLWDRAAVSRGCLEAWSAFIDRKFVQDELFARLDTLAPQAARYLESIAHKAFGGQRSAEGGVLVVESSAEVPKTTRSITRVEPFRLTAPRPRILPEPIRIEAGVRAQPVPRHVVDPSHPGYKSLAKLEAEGIARRSEVKEATLAKYDGRGRPLLATDQRAEARAVEREVRELTEAKEGDVTESLEDVRGRAYVEMREPVQ
jgi:hypothetical protein